MTRVSTVLKLALINASEARLSLLDIDRNKGKWTLFYSCFCNCRILAYKISACQVCMIWWKLIAACKIHCKKNWPKVKMSWTDKLMNRTLVTPSSTESEPKWYCHWINSDLLPILLSYLEGYDMDVHQQHKLHKYHTADLLYNLDHPLQWRHNECDGVSNHQPHGCLLKRLFRRRSKKTSKLHVTGLCEGNSPVTSEFCAQKSSYVENVTIWWRHHVFTKLLIIDTP